MTGFASLQSGIYTLLSANQTAGQTVAEAALAWDPYASSERILGRLLLPRTVEGGPISIVFDFKLYIGLVCWLGVWWRYLAARKEDRYKVVAEYCPTAILVLGFNLVALSVIQHVGHSGFVFVFTMNAINLILAQWRFSGRVLQQPTEMEDTTIECTSIYDDLSLEMLQVFTIFIGQCLLLSFMIYSSFGTYDPSGVTYGFWVAAYFVQMSGMFKRGKDSQLGTTWDVEKFSHLVEMNREVEICIQTKWQAKWSGELRVRNWMGMLVNTYFRDIIAYLAPLLLMQSDSAMDLVQNAFAMSYITKLDDLGEAKTFSVRLRAASFRRPSEDAILQAARLQAPLLVRDPATIQPSTHARMKAQ